MPPRIQGCIVYHSAMDNLPSPPEDPFSFQESRVERLSLRNRRRRLAVIATSVVVVIVAAAGYGTYRLLSSNETPIGTPVQTTLQATSPTGPIQSTLATTPELPTTAMAATSTSATPAPNLTPKPLSITTTPESVDLAITLQDGTSLTGKTPFSQDIPGGDITVEFSKEGYNTTVRGLALLDAAELRVWLDPEGQLHESVVRFKCGLDPGQVAFSADAKELWVSFLESDSLGVYDPLTGNKEGAIQTGEHGTAELLFSEDGRTVYAAQTETASVYEIDQASRTVTRRFDTGGSWTKAIALSPDQTTLWASNWGSNDISDIDLKTGTVRRLMPTVETPRGLYATADGKRLYVAGHEHGDIQRIDLATGKGTVILRTEGAMWHMIADERLGLLYADDTKTDEIYVIDLLTDEVSKLANTDQRPASMGLSPDGRVLYVANRGRVNPAGSSLPGPQWGTVLALDTLSGNILDAIVGGNQCTGLALSPDGGLLAFSDLLDHKIRVYATPTYEKLVVGEGGRSEQRFADMVKD